MLESPKTLAHRNRIAILFSICDCDAHRGPQKSQRFPRQEKAMLHCDLRVRWKVASDLRFGLIYFLGPKPLLSAGFLAIWLGQGGNRKRLRLCDFGALSEKRCNEQGDSLVWTGPQWTGRALINGHWHSNFLDYTSPFYFSGIK